MTGHQLWEWARLIFVFTFAIALAVKLVVWGPGVLKRLALRLINKFKKKPVPIVIVEKSTQEKSRLSTVYARPDDLAPHDAFDNRNETHNYAVHFWSLIQSETFDPINLDDDDEEGDSCPSLTPSSSGSRMIRRVPSARWLSSSSTLRAGGSMMMKKSRSGQRRLRHYVKRTTTSRPN